MKRKSIAVLIITGALVAAGAVGALSYGVVRAQEPTPTAPSDSTIPNGVLPFGKGWRGEKAGLVNQDLADALGIDLETLQAAQQAAYEAALQQAVEKGLITQAQADQLKTGGLGGHRFLMRWNDGTIDLHALLAEKLGISAEELQTAMLKARDAALDRAVAEGRITQEQADLMKARQALFSSDSFRSSMQSAFEAAVQQAVTDGVITQAQADQILAEQAQRGGLFGRGWGFDGFGGGPGRGGHGGRH